MFGRELLLDRLLPLGQPVHRGVDLVVHAPATPRFTPRVVSGHQASVDSFDFGRTTREMISARMISRFLPAGPTNAGSPNARAIAATAATRPCGSDRAMLNSLPAGTSVWPFSVASSADRAENSHQPSMISHSVSMRMTTHDRIRRGWRSWAYVVNGVAGDFGPFPHAMRSGAIEVLGPTKPNTRGAS